LELKTLEGATLSFPDTTVDVPSVLVFVEPPASGEKGAWAITSSPTQSTNTSPIPYPLRELKAALALEKSNAIKRVNVIPVFLSDDVNRIKAIRDANDLSGTIAFIPGGLKNPIVNKLGLLSADRYANAMVIRRDGTIAWRKHGLPYHMIGKNRYHVATNALRHHIIACDVEAGYQALNAKNYPRAIKLFTVNFLRGSSLDPHKWNSSLAHGRALTHLALKDFESAFKEIEAAIAIHSERSGGKYGQVWQFNHDPSRPCSSMIHLLTTKAKVLDHLGRKAEARACRSKVAIGPTDYPSHFSHPMGFTRPYEAFEDRLSSVAKEIK
jgi:hypothetical protein